MSDSEEHENLTRDEVIARFCQLQGKVAHEAIDGYDLPNDCFCEQPDKGGVKPGHADRGHFRSSGQALRWIEEAVERRLRGGEGERVEALKHLDRAIHELEKLTNAEADFSLEATVAHLRATRARDALSPTDGEEGEPALREYARNLLAKIREECPDLIRRGPDAIHTVENTIPRMASEVKGLRVDLECYKDAASTDGEEEPEQVEDDFICPNCGDDIREHLQAEARACFEAYKSDLQARAAPDTEGREERDDG